MPKSKKKIEIAKEPPVNCGVSYARLWLEQADGKKLVLVDEVNAPSSAIRYSVATTEAVWRASIWTTNSQQPNLNHWLGTLVVRSRAYSISLNRFILEVEFAGNGLPRFLAKSDNGIALDVKIWQGQRGRLEHEQMIGRHHTPLRVQISVPPEPILDRATVSAVRSNRLEDLAQALLPWVNAPATWTPARQTLGLVRAQQGNMNTALDLLRPLAAGLANAPTFTAVLAQVHLRRAAELVAANELVAAATDLTDALRLDPQLTPAQQVLPLLRNWQVVALVREGNLERAVEIWESEWQSRPMDLALTHWLAILYYRIVSDAERARTATLQDANAVAKLPPIHDIYWRKAIAHWGVILHSPLFWDGWKQERLNTAGLDFSGEDITAIQNAIEDRILLDLRDGASNAGTMGRNGDATKFQELETLWGLELQTARLIRECTLEYNVNSWNRGFACGPLMLEQLNTTTSGKAMVASLRRTVTSIPGKMGQELTQYLSPLARYHFLINENRIDQAIADLEKVSAWPQGKALLGVAYSAKGEELAKLGQWEDALANFERAQERGANLSAYGLLIADGGIKRAKELIADDKGYDIPIQLLERALKLVGDNREIRSNLSAMYAQKARLLNNDKHFEEAAKFIRIALKHDPEEPQTRHWASVTMGNLASDIAEKEPDRTIDLLKESMTYEDNADVRKLLSQVLFARAVVLAQAKNRDRAIQAMLDEIRYDPEANVQATSEQAKKRLQMIFLHDASEALDKNDYNKALDCIKEARQYWDDSDLRKFHAAVLSKAGRPDESIQVLRDAISRDSRNADLKHSLCVALHNRGCELGNADRHDQAIDYLTQALNIEDAPETRKALSQVYIGRGMQKVQRGDRYYGIQDLRKALEYDPNNWELKSALNRASY